MENPDRKKITTQYNLNTPFRRKDFSKVTIKLKKYT